MKVLKQGIDITQPLDFLAERVEQLVNGALRDIKAEGLAIPDRTKIYRTHAEHGMAEVLAIAFEWDDEGTQENN